jgi:hypothetical protein
VENQRFSELADDELEVVRRFNERFGGRKRPVDAETLFGGWTSFVAELENGYRGTVDDYANDLGTRDLLEELIGDSPPSLRKKLQSALEPLDERFGRATVDVDGTALSQFFNLSDGWWWRRAPREGRLATYLKEASR